MATRLSAHRQTFHWEVMAGSQEALRWNRRDLTTVDAVLTRVHGRTACVQAGGSLGIFGKYLARHFQRVYVFEPAPELFPKMVANAPEANIVRFQAALGDTAGLIGTACHRRDQSGKPVHEGLTHIVPDGIIPTLRLDDLALPVCDVLMLDLEGFELYALRGAVQTITNCRPVIVVEVNSNIECYGHTGEDVRRLLETYRYRFVERIHSDEIFMYGD